MQKAITIISLITIILTGASAGAQVPVINFPDFEEQYLRPEDDTLYVINFWATWCKPCVEELPAFEHIHNDYREQPVKVVLVSLDFDDRLHSMVVPFVRENGIKSKVLLLSQPFGGEWINKVSTEWSGAIPATLFIRQHEVRAFYEQKFDFETLNSLIENILNQQP